MLIVDYHSVTSTFGEVLIVFRFIPYIGDQSWTLVSHDPGLFLNNGWPHIVETEAEVPHILTAFHLSLADLSTVGFALKC